MLVVSSRRIVTLYCARSSSLQVLRTIRPRFIPGAALLSLLTQQLSFIDEESTKTSFSHRSGFLRSWNGRNRKCLRGLQCLRFCLRPDRIREDFHDDGHPGNVTVEKGLILDDPPSRCRRKSASPSKADLTNDRNGSKSQLFSIATLRGENSLSLYIHFERQ